MLLKKKNVTMFLPPFQWENGGLKNSKGGGGGQRKGPYLSLSLSLSLPLSISLSLSPPLYPSRTENVPFFAYLVKLAKVYASENSQTSKRESCFSQNQRYFQKHDFSTIFQRFFPIFGENNCIWLLFHSFFVTSTRLCVCVSIQQSMCLSET